MTVTIRIARPEDVPALRAIMDAAIGALMEGYLTEGQIAASRELMGLDTHIIADGTYLVAFDGAEIVGCGGWSDRATLFGGDHTGGRSNERLVPSRDRARVRAMYTAPNAARRGVGRAILAAAEDAARNAGFTEVELAATLAGEPLYRACGYEAELHFEEATASGVAVPLIRMAKRLTRRQEGAA